MFKAAARRRGRDAEGLVLLEGKKSLAMMIMMPPTHTQGNGFSHCRPYIPFFPSLPQVIV